MTRAAAIAAALALTACSDRTDTPAPAPRPSPSATLDKLNVALNGNRIVMTKAYAKRLPIDGRFQIYLTSKGGSCAELLANVFNRREGEQTFLFNLGDRLRSDRMEKVVTDVFIRGSGTVQPSSMAKVVGNADKGKPLEVTLAFTAIAGEDKYVVNGSFVAEGCGADELPTFGTPKEKHPSTATVKINGKTLPIASALRVGREQVWATGSPKTRDYILSTSLKDCSTTFPAAAVLLRREGARWYLEGEWLGTAVTNNSMIDKSGQPETKDLAITPLQASASEDGDTIQLKLAGSGTIGTYTIALDGAIEALDCPPR